MSPTAYMDPVLMILFPGTVTCQSACLNTGIRPGAVYALGGQSRVLSAGAGAALGFSCDEYPTTLCTSGSNLQSVVMANGSNWNSTPASAGGTLSATTQSVSCFANAVAPAGSAEAHFDNLFFTTDVIFASGFDSG